MQVIPLIFTFAATWIVGASYLAAFSIISLCFAARGACILVRLKFYDLVTQFLYATLLQYRDPPKFIRNISLLLKKIHEKNNSHIIPVRSSR